MGLLRHSTLQRCLGSAKPSADSLSHFPPPLVQGAAKQGHREGSVLKHPGRTQTGPPQGWACLSQVESWA